jgi:hypothetical protein
MRLPNRYWIALLAPGLTGCASEGADGSKASAVPIDGRVASAGGVSVTVPRDAQTSGFVGDPAVFTDDAPVHTITGIDYRIAINVGIGRFDLTSFKEVDRPGPEAFERVETAGQEQEGTLVFPKAEAGPPGWHQVSPTVTWTCRSVASCGVARGVLSTLKIDPAVLHSNSPPPRAATPRAADHDKRGKPPIMVPPKGSQ